MFGCQVTNYSGIIQKTFKVSFDDGQMHDILAVGVLGMAE